MKYEFAFDGTDLRLFQKGMVDQEEFRRARDTIVAWLEKGSVRYGITRVVIPVMNKSAHRVRETSFVKVEPTSMVGKLMWIRVEGPGLAKSHIDMLRSMSAVLDMSDIEIIGIPGPDQPSPADAHELKPADALADAVAHFEFKLKTSMRDLANVNEVMAALRALGATDIKMVKITTPS